MSIWDWLVDDRDIFVHYRIVWIILLAALLLTLLTLTFVYVKAAAPKSSAEGRPEDHSLSGQADVMVSPV